MINKHKGAFSLTLVILLILSINISFVFAHKISVTEVEPGIVKVYYADGSSPTMGEGILYNEDFIELYRSQLSSDGTFQFPTDLGGHVILINDGAGHRVRWTIGEEESPMNEVLVILLVSIGFVLIALFFHQRNKRKIKVT